ncbi:MAG: SpoIIE family protein phosphatase [Bacillota bacterium]|nr:SpoIIE family protein phosphatase [Bacillota bacterium]
MQRVKFKYADSYETERWEVLAIKWTSSFICAFFISRFSLFGQYMPLGISLAAALPLTLPGYLTMCGVVLGMVSITYDPVSIQFISASLVVLGARLLFKSSKDISEFKLFSESLATAVYLTTALASMIGRLGGITDYLLIFIEAVLCFASVRLFKYIISGLKKLKDSVLTDNYIKISIIIGSGIALLSASQISLYGIAPARILAILTVVIASYSTGALGGCTTGIIVGLAYASQDTALVPMAVTLAFSAFVAGAVGRLKKPATAISFVIIFGLLCYYFDKQLIISSLAEASTACLIFLILSSSVLNNISQFMRSILRFNEDSFSESKNPVDFIQNRLASAYETINEMSTIDDTNSSIKEKINVEDISEVFSYAADKVCRRCGLAAFCWGADYSSVMASLNDLVPVLKEKEKLDVSDIGNYFKCKCAKLKEFITAVNSEYEQYKALGKQRSEDEKELIAFKEQYRSFSYLLSELSSDITCASNLRSDISEKVAEYFQSLGIKTLSIASYENKRRMLVVEAVLSNAVNIKQSDIPLLDFLKKLTGKKGFDIYIEKRDDDYYCLITEKEHFEVKINQSACAKTGEEKSGDHVAAFKTHDGKYYIILSDGMGSGEEACSESSFVTTYLERLIKSGISAETAMKMVNTAFCIRNAGDEFATVDMIAIDLYTGKAEIIKAGAAPTFVIRGQKYHTIESGTLPVGMFASSEIRKTELRLNGGDSIIMGSDGVFDPDDDEDILRDIMCTYHDEKESSVSSHIMLEAGRRHIGTKSDDMTVVEIKINKK